MAQGQHYNEPFFWHRVVNLGWGGGWGVLTIDYPDGQNLSFDSHSDWNFIAPHGIAVVTDQVINPVELDPAPATIYPTSFDHPLEIETLYEIPFTNYSYQVVAASSVVSGSDNSAWIAEQLATFPGASVHMCAGNFPGPDPPYGGGLITMDEEIFPDCSGPANPGFDNYIVYFGPTPIEGTLTRKAVRKVWLIDFSRWRAGETVEIVNADTGPDEHLPDYDTTVRLTTYPRSAVLKGADDTITSDSPASTVQTILRPYTSGSLGVISSNSIAV